MIKVGISGKIASGKSEAENILREFGFFVFDLDLISHKLFEENEEIQNEILKEFNTLNRKEIGKIVFQNENKKEKLEQIIHPKLKEKIEEIFNKFKHEKAIFISGALLFKSGFDSLFDKTIFIDANENIRLERLMKRNNLSRQEALLRLNLQDDGAFADFIIENNSNIENLKTKIQNILNAMF